MICQWISGWLEPVKSDHAFESLFKRLCVDSHGTRQLPTRSVPPPESREEPYRVPSTLVMVGRACVDKVSDLFEDGEFAVLGLR